jgi:hypothetical protein
MPSWLVLVASSGSSDGSSTLSASCPPQFKNLVSVSLLITHEPACPCGGTFGPAGSQLIAGVAVRRCQVHHFEIGTNQRGLDGSAAGDPEQLLRWNRRAISRQAGVVISPLR